MDLVVLREVIGGTSLVDVDICRRELAEIRSGRGLLDAREVEVLARLDELTATAPGIFPEDEIATAARSSLSKATRVRARKKTCDHIPELGSALADGDTTGDRVDAVTKATAGLSPAELDRVAQQGAVLAAAAANLSDRQFREVVERVVGQVRDDDGLDRLARQRRASRLRWWNNPDGMWNLSGTFDPVRGAELEGRLRHTIEALFHDTTPDDTPSDLLQRQDHLAALALMALCEGGSGSGSGPDVTVLIDERTLLEGRRHEHSVIDAGLGRFGLPVETIRRWACLGTVTPVVVAADGTRLFLGRETRLANRAQRRALPRALPNLCAV